MTAVVSSNPGADNINAQKSTKVEGFAAATIGALVACRVNSAGAIVPSDGTLADAAAAVHGVSLRQANSGEPVSIYGIGTVFQWTSAGTLTPGAAYFVLGDAAGGVDDSATTGDSTGVFVAVSTTDLMLVKLQTVGA